MRNGIYLASPVQNITVGEEGVDTNILPNYANNVTLTSSQEFFLVLQNEHSTIHVALGVVFKLKC